MKNSNLLLSAGIAGIVAAMFYCCRPIFILFLGAVALAYILDNGASWLQRYSFSRSSAAALMVTLAIVIIAVLGTTILPLLYRRILGLLTKFSSFRYQDLSWIHDKISPFFPDLYNEIRHISDQLMRKLTDSFGLLLGSVVDSGNALLEGLAVCFILPIIIFYLLKDWQSLLAGSIQLIPRRFQKETIRLAILIDKAMHGYFRGQGLICCVMIVYYVVALTAINLESSLLLGICSGTIIIVPFLGYIIMCSTSILVSLLQYGTIHHVLLVLMVYGLGIFTENGFLTPKILRHQLGVHPVWILFGLMISGQLLGFWGILISVPLTAIITRVISFCVEKYLNSQFYKQQ